jgi:hypothetical protein
MTPSSTIALPVSGWTIDPTIVAAKIASSVHASRVTPSGRGSTAINTPTPIVISHRGQVFEIELIPVNV